jgi:hypothetical protein
MNKRPGHVTVTTEVGYCNFCQRTRNLRREDHQLGQLVRTIVACETCHRTLSSTIGVAAAPELEPVKEEAPVVEAAVVAEDTPKPRRAPVKRKPAAAAKPKLGAAAKARSAAAAKSKPAAAAKAKAKTPAKPTSTATRPTTRKK